MPLRWVVTFATLVGWAILPEGDSTIVDRMGIRADTLRSSGTVALRRILSVESRRERDSEASWACACPAGEAKKVT